MSLNLSVNGTPYSISEGEIASDPFYTPTTTLLDFIRVKTPYTATKYCCGEGGCGCCTVSLTTIDNATTKPTTRPVNSCLALLFSLDGSAVTTNEGTGNSIKGYSDFQKAMAANNAFQCSMCTSGKTMLATTYLAENPNATQKEMQDILDGSLCRCGAYMGILQTFAQFGSKSSSTSSENVNNNINQTVCMKENCCQKRHLKPLGGIDVEDASVPLSWDEADKGLVQKHHDKKQKKMMNNNTKKNQQQKGRTLRTIAKNSSDSDDDEEETQNFAAVVNRSDKTLPPSYTDAVKISSPVTSASPSSAIVKAKNNNNGPDVPYIWQDCATLQEVAQYYNQYKDQKVHVIKNATSFGIFHDYRMGEFNVFLHLTNNIVEMQGALMISNAAKIGANCTIKDVIQFLDSNSTQPGADVVFPAITKHLGRVAGTAIRNRATIGGNLALCKNHSTTGDSFPSDAAIVLLGAQAQLVVFDLVSQSQKVINLSDYYTSAYNGATTIILQIIVPLVPAAATASSNFIFKSYKIAVRQVMDHAIVNAAMTAQVSKTDGKISNAVVAIGGCFPAPTRITAVEQMLSGGSPTDQTLFQNAASVLAKAIQAGIDPTEGRVQYRVQVAQNYLYKFFLALQGTSLPANLVQASQPWMVKKDVQVSNQSHGTGDPKLYPVGQAMPKLDAITLAAGEAQFVGDNPLPGNCLFGAPVLTTQANAPITGIDKTAGSVVPGFVQYFDEKDAPSNKFAPGPPQLFAGNFSYYASQLVGIAVAESQSAARLAAKKIQETITYGAVAGPIILTPNDCVEHKTYFTPGKPGFELKQGNAASAIAAAAKKISGTMQVGSQYHVHLENHVTTVIPTESGYEVDVCTQCVSTTRDQIAETLQVCSSSVQVKCRRCGGGFGSKQTASAYVCAATGVAAKALRRPIKMDLTMQEGMKGLGARSPYRLDYTIGVDKNNKIVGLQGTMYICTGYEMNDCGFEAIVSVPTLDNCYQIPNADISCFFMRSNTAPNTSVRGPGWVTAQIFAEQMMNKVARQLNVDPVEFRNINLHQEGDITFSNMKIESPGLSQVWDPLYKMYSTARTAANQFNSQNKFVKRGVALGPIRFPITWTGANFQAMVAIYPDASIAVSSGGAEIGQGLHDKIIAAAAYALGLTKDDLPTFRALPNNTGFISQGNGTGGSITSDLCALAVLHTCQELNTRLAPHRQEGQTWAELVTAAGSAGVDLTARGTSGIPSLAPFRYNTYGACCAQVEVDGLTGQFELKQVDIMFDVGQSINPDIDMNQVAGGFTMGLGLVTLESCNYDKTTGQALDATTWRYKPPTAYEVPGVFNVTLLPNSYNRSGVLSSKACGEPPMAMSMAVVSAIEDAVNSVRSDNNNNNKTTQGAWTCTSTPLTVDQIALACGVPTSALNV